MPDSQTFKYRERFEGSAGVLPGEVAPRLVLVHDFPAGPDGLTSPRAGAGLGANDIIRLYSDGNPDYGVDFARVFGDQRFAGFGPGAIDTYRVVASDAVRATVTLTDQDDTTPIDIGAFTAVGAGVAYNKTITLVVTDVIASGHPAGANTPVFKVTIPAPNPDANDEVFERIVFTQEDGRGTSAYHRTRDASVLNDLSFIVDFNYVPAAATADLAANATKGDVITLTLAGGTAGGALADADWQAALDELADLPFRWLVIPNPPTDTVRADMHTTIKGMPFGFAALIQMYGETPAAILTARDTLGSEADDGRSAMFFGWGPHPSAGGREVSFAAGYLGLASAKINAGGLGGDYPVGNTGLGFTKITDVLTKADKGSLAAESIMYAQQLYDGSFGVHGSWTLDSQLDRMGDLGVRWMWNDILRRLALQFTPLAHNRGATPLTQTKIKRLGDAAISPYLSKGVVRIAETGTAPLEEANTLFPGLSFPADPGWVAYVARVVFYLTLQGVYVHATDAEIAGLASLAGSGGGGEEPAAA